MQVRVACASAAYVQAQLQVPLCTIVDASSLFAELTPGGFASLVSYIVFQAILSMTGDNCFKILAPIIESHVLVA
jgi:hypothetical protein